MNTIQNFINEYREEISDVIKTACPNCQFFDDDELRLWILNDESLYNWAISEGVDV